MCDPDDHWNAQEEDTFEGECDRCGEDGLCQIHHDPYDEETDVDFDPDTEERTSWCRLCWQQRKDDV